MLFLAILALEVVILYLLARKTSKKILVFLNRITKSKKLSVYLFAALFLPGTFVHEMSHFLTALFLLVPVGKVELFPEIKEEEIKMGSVAIGKTGPVRRTIVGVAPIIFGLAIILGSTFWAYGNGFLNKPIVVVLLAYLIFEVGNTMFSSKKDLEGAFTVFATIFLFYGFLYYFGFRVNLNINSDIIKIADIFLLVPIIIDSIFLLIARRF